MFIKYTILTAALLSVVACSQTPSIGDKMVAQSESTKQLGEQWSDGEKSVSDAKKLTKNGGKLVKKGHKNIYNGKKMVSKGERQVAKGDSLIKKAIHKNKDGQALQLKSEAQFKENFPQK